MSGGESGQVSVSTMRGHSEKVDVYSQEGASSPEADRAGTLAPDF